MSYETLDELKDLMLECFGEAGVLFDDRSPRQVAPGLLVVDYVFFTEQDEAETGSTSRHKRVRSAT